MGIFSFFKKSGPQVDVTAAVFSLLGALAAADGRVTEDEERVVVNFLDEYLVLDENQRSAALESFRNAAKEGLDLPAAASVLARRFDQASVVLLIVVDVLLEVAQADGEISPNEEQLIRRVGAHFGIPTAEVDRLKALHTSAIGRDKDEIYYRRLGIDPTVSSEEFERCYKRVCLLHEPGEFAHKGLPEGFNNLLQKRMEDIEEAYSILKARRQRNQG